MPHKRILITLLLTGFSSHTYAQTNNPQAEMGTPEQRAACGPDVARFCKSIKPEDGPMAYLSCLQTNREKLRPACVKVIEGGQ